MEGLQSDHKLSLCLELLFVISLLEDGLPKVVFFNFMVEAFWYHVCVTEDLVIAVVFLFVVCDIWPVNVFVAPFKFEMTIWVSVHFGTALIVVIIAGIGGVFVFEAVGPVDVVSPERVVVIEFMFVLIAMIIVWRLVVVVMVRVV